METRTRKFILFFSVTTAHNWFGGGPCPYVSLEPAADCRILLARRRLICRQVPGGLQVITELTASGDGSPSGRRRVASGMEGPDHYRFLIRLVDTAFFAVTRMDLTGYPGQLFCYSNTAKGARLSLKKYQNPGRCREAILGMV